MSRERPGHNLQTTALVNEAYLRLVNVKQVSVQNRAQFFGLSARIMRNILVDFARNRPRSADKREPQHVSLDDALTISSERSRDLIALDAGQLPDGRAYFVMQYVPGRTLESVMTPREMNPKRVADLLHKIAQALDAAHEQGVIHRDLKPANIMLQTVATHTTGLPTIIREEYIKIIDFGIATVREASPALASKDTRIVGTLPYMAPEQFVGRPSAASDIFALGVIVFEMITGQLPFNADTITQQIELQRAGVEGKLRELRAGLPERLARRYRKRWRSRLQTVTAPRVNSAKLSIRRLPSLIGATPSKQPLALRRSANSRRFRPQSGGDGRC